MVRENPNITTSVSHLTHPRMGESFIDMDERPTLYSLKYFIISGLIKDCGSLFGRVYEIVFKVKTKKLV
jgi:hypothetical protein